MGGPHKKGNGMEEREEKERKKKGRKKVLVGGDRWESGLRVCLAQSKKKFGKRLIFCDSGDPKEVECQMV